MDVELTHPTKPSAVLRYALLSALFLLAPSLALAAGGSPFASGTATMKTDLVTLLTPIVSIAVIAFAFAWLFGKLAWYWITGIVVGTVAVFGSDQIVSWVRSWFGV